MRERTSILVLSPRLAGLLPAQLLLRARLRQLPLRAKLRPLLRPAR